MDREKILSAFDKCCHVIPCDTCEWDACRKLRMPIPKMHIPYDLCIAVLALLKEQGTSNTGKARIFQCEKCGYGFDDIFLIDEHNYDIEPNYCPNCGRSVKLNA